MNVTLTFTRDELEKAMTESSVVRGLVLSIIFPVKDTLESIIKAKMAFHSGNYIAAIKFLRQYAVDNGLPQYASLADAKVFIEKMGWPR